MDDVEEAAAFAFFQDFADADDWQIYYYRDNAWSSPLSSAAGGGTGSAGGQTALPDGVRLVLQLGAGAVVQGPITRDWVSPTVGPGGS